MKKIRMLNISLITGALTLPAITALVSCNKPIVEKPDVTLDDYWSINYHFSDRREAPYQLNLLNCQAGDTAEISITSQTIGGVPVEDYLVISSGEAQTIEEGQKTLEFKLLQTTTFSEPTEVEAVINVVLKRDGTEILNKDFKIYAEWAKPIPKDELNIGVDIDTGKKTLYGFNNPESLKGQDYTMLYVPEDVEVIADYAFYGSKTTIPSTVKWLLLDESWGRGESKLKEIGREAFRYAELNDLTIFIPSSVETIKEQAFMMCTKSSSHTSLRFGSNSKLKTIGKQAFDNDHINDQIILPRGLESIDNKGLSENDPKKLFIPNSLKKVDRVFFYGYENLELIDMSEWTSLPIKGVDAWIVNNLFNSETGKNYFDTTGNKAKIRVSTDDDWINFFKECGLNETYWQLEKI